MFSLLWTGCAYFKAGRLPAEQPSRTITSYEEVRLNEQYCRGRGQIVSSGDYNGRLNFTFSASRDTAYIQFTDLIGRKSLFMILVNNDARVWDMIHNQQFNLAATLIRFPFLEIIGPADLQAFLWGEVPEKIRSGRLNQPDAIRKGTLQFHSEQTKYGPLVTKINFTLEDRQKIDLTILKREFGSTYPHLQRGIPSAVPLSIMD